MKLKIFYANVYYPHFVEDFYRQYSALNKASYRRQLNALYRQAFGIANFYPLNFRKLGHVVQDIVINIGPM